MEELFSFIWLVLPIPLFLMYRSEKKKAKRLREYQKFVQYLWNNGRMTADEYRAVTGYYPFNPPRFAPPPFQQPPFQQQPAPQFQQQQQPAPPLQPQPVPPPQQQPDIQEGAELPLTETEAAALEEAAFEELAPDFDEAFEEAPEETPEEAFNDDEFKKRVEEYVRSHPAAAARKPRESVFANDVKNFTVGKLMLLIGAFFIIVAGLVFSGAAWSSMSSGGRVAMIAASSAFFLGASCLFGKKLELPSTGVAFFALSGFFSAITFVTMGNYRLLGDALSFDGGLDWVFRGLTLLIVAAFCAFGRKIYKSEAMLYLAISFAMTGCSLFVFQSRSYPFSMAATNVLAATGVYLLVSKRRLKNNQLRIPVLSTGLIAEFVFAAAALPMVLGYALTLEAWSAAIVLVWAAQLLYYSGANAKSSALMKGGFAATILLLSVKLCFFNKAKLGKTYLITFSDSANAVRLTIFCFVCALLAAAFLSCKRIRCVYGCAQFALCAGVGYLAAAAGVCDSDAPAAYAAAGGLIAAAMTGLAVFLYKKGSPAARPVYGAAISAAAGAIFAPTLVYLDVEARTKAFCCVCCGAAVALSSFVPVYIKRVPAEKRGALLPGAFTAASLTYLGLACVSAEPTFTRLGAIAASIVVFAELFVCGFEIASALALFAAFISAAVLAFDCAPAERVAPTALFWIISAVAAIIRASYNKKEAKKRFLVLAPATALFAAQIIAGRAGLFGERLGEWGFFLGAAVLAAGVPAAAKALRRGFKDVFVTAFCFAGACLSCACGAFAADGDETALAFSCALAVAIFAAMLYIGFRRTAVAPLVIAFICSIGALGVSLSVFSAATGAVLAAYLVATAIASNIDFKANRNTKRYYTLIPPSFAWLAAAVSQYASKATGRGLEFPTACAAAALLAAFAPVVYSKKIKSANKPLLLSAFVVSAIASSAAAAALADSAAERFAVIAVCILVFAAAWIVRLGEVSVVPLVLAFAASSFLVEASDEYLPIAAFVWLGTAMFVFGRCLADRIVGAARPPRFLLLAAPTVLWISALVREKVLDETAFDAAPYATMGLTLVFLGAFAALRKGPIPEKNPPLSGLFVFGAAILCSFGGWYFGDGPACYIPAAICALAAFAAAETQKINLAGILPMSAAFAALFSIPSADEERLFFAAGAFAALIAYSRLRYGNGIVERADGGFRVDIALPFAGAALVIFACCRPDYAEANEIGFFTELGLGVLALDLIRRSYKASSNALFASIASAILLFAVLTRPFLVPESFYARNILRAAAIFGFGLALRYIWKKCDEALSLTLRSAAFAGAFSIIVLGAYFNQETPEFFTALGLAVCVLVYSVRIKSGRWFLLSAASTAFILAYSFRGYFVKLDWWIYLLAIGVIMVSAAAANEYSKKKNKSLTSKMKEYVSSWKW